MVRGRWKRRLWCWIGGLLLAAGALLLWAGLLLGGHWLPTGAGLLLLLAGGALALAKVRCPFCRRYLGTASEGWRFCPHCGAALDVDPR